MGWGKTWLYLLLDVQQVFLILGINTLLSIMSRFGEKEELESRIPHNERLEFLGDAVVEFLSTVHLYLMFPGVEEGGLATYRAAIVQNQHLAVLSEKMGLQHYLLFAHGSDLCDDLAVRHALANCFEALMGALFLDGGIQVGQFKSCIFQNVFNMLGFIESAGTNNDFVNFYI